MRGGVDEEAELALLDVLLGLEEAGHVGDVLEEGGAHEGLLAVEAGDLGDFVDEVEEARRDVDDLAAHDLEELAQEEAGLHDEVDGSDLLGAVVVALAHQELLHLDVVVLAEQLQEAEDPAQRQLVVQLRLDLELVRLVTEHLHQDVLLAVEVVVRVHDLVRKHPLLLVLLELTHLDQEVTDVLYQVLETGEGDVLRICEELSQERVLAVRVAVEEVDYS